MIGGIPTGPVVPMAVGKKAGIGAIAIARRAAKVLKYGTPAVVFLYGAIKVRGLIRKSKKRKMEKQQQKHVAEMYAEFKKQKQR